MNFLITDIISFFFLGIALVLLITNVYLSVKHKNKEINNKSFVISIILLGLFLLSSFFIKYEVKHYVDNGYILYKSVGFMTPEYENVKYDDYSKVMYEYNFRIDRKSKIIYMFRKVR